MSAGTPEPVVYLACSPWSFLRQREHEFATGLAAAGRRVFFIEPMPSLAGRFREILRPDPAAIGYPKQAPEGLTVLRPPTCLTFFRSSLTPAVDRRQLLRWLREAIRAHRLEGCDLIYSFAYWEYLGVVPRIFNARRTLFDYSDDESVYARTGRSLARMRGASMRLAAGADAVLYSSRAMENRDVVRFARRARYLPNGVRDALCLDPTEVRAPGGEREGQQVVGYVGQRSERILDAPLLRRISESGSWKLRFAGSVEPRFRRALPSASFEGFVSPDRMGAFIDSCDVCIIPFARNPVADLVEPLKMYEYCARGKPVVATATPSLEPFAEWISLARTEEEFLGLIGRAAREDTEEKKIARVVFARRNRWSEHIPLLQSILHGSEQGDE